MQYVHLSRFHAIDDGEVIGVMQVKEAITGINLSGKHIRHSPNWGRHGNDALLKRESLHEGAATAASTTSSHEGTAMAAFAMYSHKCAATAESARSSHEGTAMAPFATPLHKGAATAPSTTLWNKGATTAVSAKRLLLHVSSMGMSLSASGENLLALTVRGGRILSKLGRDVKLAMVVFFVFSRYFFLWSAFFYRPRLEN
jgi:hypothetical protein